MHVVATAGHVDHGKTTLVRALTGMEPDRLADEQRRGMTVDLGFAWTTLSDGSELAFVDVPGHQRFIANLLAGLGAAPAVLFVVAADAGWSRQSEEHLAVLDALGVRHVLLAVTRSDRAAPEPVALDAQRRFVDRGVGAVDAIAVAAPSGMGLPELRGALERLVARLPKPRHDGPVRFWVDRAFTIRGTGTVVTGTLGSGMLTSSDVLTLRGRTITVRGIQALGRDRGAVQAISRVALALRGVSPEDIGRGDVLLTPDSYLDCSVADVRLSGAEPPRGELVLHVGTAAVPVRLRPLGGDTARLTLARALPLRVGDRAVLRDPGRQSVAAGVLVLDADPPALSRRGDAARRAAALRDAAGETDVRAEIRRRGVVRREHVDRLGYDTSTLPDRGGWLIDPAVEHGWLQRAPELVARWAATHPLDPAMPRAALRDALGVPEALLDDAVAAADLRTAHGRVSSADASAPRLGTAETGLAVLLARLAETPFAAPERGELDELGLGPREVAAAVRTHRLIQPADGVVLAPDAPARAAAVLRTLGPRFTVSEARQAWGTTRRVAVPLLELLDHQAVTVRVEGTTQRQLRRAE